MKANFDFNRLSESRKQELDRMVADFSEAGCLFVEDLFLEFLISSMLITVLTAATISLWQPLMMRADTSLCLFSLRKRFTM